MDKVNVTVRLDPDRIASLDHLAKLFDRDRTYLIREAVDAYLARQCWQTEEVERAVAEAAAGDFVPDAAMARLLKKWSR